MAVELNSSEKDASLISHLNIRRMSKNFENLKTFSVELGFGFQIICLTESWCSIYGLPGYDKVNQVRNHGQGVGFVSFFTTL